MALTATITNAEVRPITKVEVDCERSDVELLFVDWLDAVTSEMSVRKMLFGRFAVTLDKNRLHGTLWGEAVEVQRHAPACEPKGATLPSSAWQGTRPASGARPRAHRGGRHHGRCATRVRIGARIPAPDGIAVTIHCGSRGLGHHIGSDFLKEMADAAPAHGLVLPDRELACAPIDSELGRRYLGAMGAGINCGLANREILGHFTRRVVWHFFPGADLSLLFDVSHNICMLERHAVR